MPCATILETMVKENNVNKVRKVFGNNWKWLDNYTHHPNCTIWILWKEGSSDINNKESSDQYIHYKVNNVSNSYALIVIYAHNQLINRRKIWMDINQLANSIQGPWMLVGDFNNVLNVKDKIGGNSVQKVEYKDLKNMMDETGLYDHDTI